MKILTAENRAKVAKMNMLPLELCNRAAMVAFIDKDTIPDTLSECQEDLKQTKSLLAGALGSHIICHAKLSIAKESSAQKNQLDNILKGCKE